MKPRTKLQFRVVGLSSQLPDIKSMMTEWANNDCLNHIGYATKSRVVCMECGERFSTELVNRKRAVCPHCGASLKIEWSRKRTNQQFIRIGKADICEEFQVIRCFELYAYYREGREPHYFIREVLQHWIKDDGKREVMALAIQAVVVGVGILKFVTRLWDRIIVSEIMMFTVINTIRILYSNRNTQGWE